MRDPDFRSTLYLMSTEYRLPATQTRPRQPIGLPPNVTLVEISWTHNAALRLDTDCRRALRPADGRAALLPGASDRRRPRLG